MHHAALPSQGHVKHRNRSFSGYRTGAPVRSAHHLGRMPLLRLSALVPDARHGSAFSGFSGAPINRPFCRPLARQLTWWLIAWMALASLHSALTSTLVLARCQWRRDGGGMPQPGRALGSPRTTAGDMTTHTEAPDDVSASKTTLGCAVNDRFSIRGLTLSAATDELLIRDACDIAPLPVPEHALSPPPTDQLPAHPERRTASPQPTRTRPRQSHGL